MLGIQFEALFEDGRYLEISRRAIGLAIKLKECFRRRGIPLATDSPTNQQFVILSEAQHRSLSKEFAFEIWEKRPDGALMCRFVTSWATTESEIDKLDAALAGLI